jgi:hypothetical protein
MPSPCPVNSLSVEVSTVPHPREARAFYVATLPVVDGARILAHDDIVQLTLLVASEHSEGTYHLFSCHCGEPGCGGYFKGVDVRQYAASLTWVHLDLRAASVKYEFDRKQYVAAIAECVDAISELLRASGGAAVAFQAHADYALFPDWLEASESAVVSGYTAGSELWGFRRLKSDPATVPATTPH